MEFIRDLWKNKGTTVVMVTHEPVVAQYSQRIIHIHDGAIDSEEKTNGVNKKINLKTK